MRLIIAWVVSAFMSTAAAVAQPQGSSKTTPNVLWLIAEDFGPHLGCYGTREFSGGAVSTPNLDQLAREGMRFTRCFTTAPVCSPSRSAFMTGMYQTTINAHNHRSHRDDGYRLPAGVRLLTDRLRDAGYFTANVRAFPPQVGFRGSGKTDWNFTTESNTFDSDKWSDLEGHQPFYAQVNFQETHRPFRAPQRVPPDKVQIPPYYPDHEVTRRDWAAYLDAAVALDRKVGVVLDELERSGLASNTVVFFFGDNGQAHVRGKQFCYDSGLHVPLIIRWPDRWPAPAGYRKGRSSDQLISAIDLTATTLSLAGLRKPAGMQGEIFLGSARERPRQYVFAARDRCDETVFRFRTVRDERNRYIRNFTPERPLLQSNEYKERQYPVWNLLKELNAEGKLEPAQKALCAPTMPSEELYDLERDPHEIQNLASSPRHARTMERLRRALEDWIEASNDQGKELEPADLAARKGVTKPGTPPNTGYTLDGAGPQGSPQRPNEKP